VSATSVHHALTRGRLGLEKSDAMRAILGRRVDFAPMRQVSDAFLLNMAEVSAALIGLFFVGMLFYVETGFERAKLGRTILVRYFRASTRIVLILYAIPLGLSLALVVLEPLWTRVFFALLSLLLVAANVDTAIRVRGVAKTIGSRALLVNEVLGTVGVVLIVVIPWALGGLHPTREDLTWAVLLSFATGFLSIGAAILSAFDIERLEDDHRP
jgi:hypothetical protein